MAFIGGLFSGDKGANFEAKGANIQQPTTTGQANEQYGNAQNALQYQKAFLDAVSAQNGLQNQANVYNQLQDIYGGKGPNAAQAMLNQSTGQNVANQAALMAGQRGAGANVGLMARQAAQQGAGIQQQAVGQGATLQAQQAMNALSAAGSLANQQVAQQAAANQNYNQFAQGEQSNVLNALAGQNAANVNMQGNMNNANAGIAQGNQAFQAGAFKGLMNGASSASSMMSMAKGGMVKGYADGGDVAQPNMGGNLDQMVDVQQPQPAANPTGPQSNVGKVLAGTPDSAMMFQAPNNPHAAAIEKDAESTFSPSSSKDSGGGSGGGMGSMLSMLALLSKGGSVNGEMLAAQGKRVPGKADVKGDSLKNDKVKALLSPGEIVIPRSIANAKDAPKQAAKFVAAVIARGRHNG